ncbi:MAG: hypothetical protein AAB699_03495 [Patescibacteria group bacterium]
MVISGLGLKEEEVAAFVKGQQPTYPKFETWVREQPGVKRDKTSVDALNASIAGYNHADGMRKSILEANSLPDDESTPHDAVNLNNLDDWKSFHDQLAAAS